MVKLSASRKKFILVIFAVLVVCAFLATSLVPSIGHSGTGANSQSTYDVHSNPLLSNNNNPSSAGYIKYTLILSNNTLVKGNFIITDSGTSPNGITFDSNNGYVYVAESGLGSNIVSVINGLNNTVIDTITVGYSPFGYLNGITFDSNNGYVYVANSDSNIISVINGLNNTVIDTITVGTSPYGVAFDPSNAYLYVANYYSNDVSVINGASNKVINNITVGTYPDRVTFDPSNGYVYVANDGSYNISVINGASNKVIDTITVGSSPGEAAFDPSNGYIYVTNSEYNSVSVINGTTNKVIDTITVGSSPYGDDPTVMVSITLLDAPLITDTLLYSEFVT